jgi:aspartate racemase
VVAEKAPGFAFIRASVCTMLTRTISPRGLARPLFVFSVSASAAGEARLVRRLAAAGAEIAAVTSMAGHFCVGELQAMSPLPIFNAIPEVDAAIRRRGLKTVGMIGTRTVMESGLYGGISSAAIVLPEGDALEQVHKAYVEMAIAGRVTDAQRRTFFSIGQQLCRVQGAEAVLLGGTDLCLAFEGQDCGFPVIDCADVHIEAFYRWSIGKS